MTGRCCYVVESADGKGNVLASFIVMIP